MDVRLEGHHARGALTRELGSRIVTGGARELSREPRAHRGRRHQPTVLPGDSAPPRSGWYPSTAGAPAQTPCLEEKAAGSHPGVGLSQSANWSSLGRPSSAHQSGQLTLANTDVGFAGPVDPRDDPQLHHACRDEALESSISEPSPDCTVRFGLVAGAEPRADLPKRSRRSRRPRRCRNS
jgi:hypothetical protein